MEENEDKLSQAVNDTTKAVENKVKDTGKKVTKKALKEMFKLAFNAIKNAILFFLAHPILLIVSIIIIIFVAVFAKIIKNDDADRLTAYGKTSISTVLGINDISELVTINGTPKGGYSLAFVDDIDDKLEKVIESDKQYQQLDIDVDTLKEYVKAELVTQLPYLGDGVSGSKLPDLDGVDILYEPEETSNLVNSMDGILMLGDSYTVGLESTGMLAECTFKCKVGVAPSYWIEHFSSLPSNVTGVCVLLGVNNPSQTSEMKQLIDKLCEKYPGKPIYVQKVFPLGKNYSGGVTQNSIDNFNKAIEKYCSDKETVFWIDTTESYVDERGYLISDDGLHPKDYKTLVSNIKNKILSNRGSSESSDGELQGSNPKEAIWGYLIGKGFSEAAAAGIMGNWEAESGFKSNCVQGDYLQSNPTQYDEDYARGVNTGSISKDDFIYNGPGGGGYGLAQWTTYSRKEGLYEFAKDQGTDIDDLKMQLDYFMKELESSSYNSLLEDSFKCMDGGAESAIEAAIKFHEIYEGSADSDEQVRNNRGGNAEKIYNELHGTIPSGTYSTASAKRAMAVTDREVDKENEFQPAVKLKRVIPNKDIGELKEVKGKVVEMTYVPQGVFNAYINQQNENVLEVFTLNNNREVVFAKWTYNEGTVKFEKASSVNICTVMEKYTMPYDYLMMLNVYGEDVKFCLGLAELALESEYIVAVQDQVTTTYTSIEYTEAIYDEETQQTYYQYDGPYGKVKEQSAQKIELTYADSWAITLANEVTYYDNKKVNRKDIASTSTGPTSTTEGNMTITESSTTVVNKYESGETTVEKDDGGNKFVELYNKCENFKLTEPSWLFEGLNSNAKTTKLVDLTKYLLYKVNAVGDDYAIKDPDVVFSQYEENEFKEVKDKNKGTVGWAFIRAWENNELRKFMEDDGTYTYDSSTNIYSCVTENREKYILHDEIGEAVGNKVYGIEVKIYDTSVGYGWQNVDLFEEQGINIKESEYNVYGESEIDVEIVDNISIKIWNSLKEKVQKIAEARDVEIKSHQIDCLVDILYENGNVYKVINAFKEYGLDEEKMKEACEEAFSGKRGNARWILFSEGKYCTPLEGEELDPNDYYGGGEFYEIAYELHEYLREQKYWYPSSANLAAGGYVSDGTPVTHKLPVKGESASSRYVDCSSYVSWVISQYTEKDNCWATGDLIKNPMNFEVIATSTSAYTEDDLQPGDILVVHNGNSQHTEIYAGDGKTLNCGNTSAIRSEFSNYSANYFTHVFRASD